MFNFTYYNPVRIVFGKNTIAELPQLIPAGSKIMLTYGGGSIKRNGVYEQIISALRGYKIIEFGGIEPNPSYETCMEGVKLARAEKIDFLLSAGGGSVLDGTKFIAAATHWTEGDPWEILQRCTPQLTTAIPLGCVLTLPATGSEMNNNAVVSRHSSKEKFYFADPLVYPKFSIIDPQTTYSLPVRQTVNGIIDTFVHVMEQYMTWEADAPLQDRQAEAIIKTLLEEAPKVMAHPEDYNARANLCWCATMALNGLIGSGVPQDWGTHMIGHELTALYGLDHAATLAIVMPRLWQHQLGDKEAKLKKFGREVFGEADAVKTISHVENFFNWLGMKTRLADYGIDATEAANEVCKRFTERNFRCGEKENIDGLAAAEILKKC